MTKATWFGTEVIADYGNVEAEYRAVRESAGVIDLSWRGKIRFVGPDRHQWLQGQISNEVLSLPPGKGQEACALEVKGHIVAFLRLVNAGEYLLADINPDICAATIQRLDFYRIMEKVDLQNATGELGLVGVYGPKSHELMAEWLNGWLAESEYDCTEREVAGAKWLIVNTQLTREGGYEIYAPRTVVTDLIAELVKRGATPFGIEALNIFRVENGRPWQPFELNEGVFPHEAGIENRAVSFTKGCYIGQEVVARIHSRGHVNRKLVQLKFSGEVLPNHDDKLIAADHEREIGRVTSVVRSPHEGLIGLGYVRREHAEPGTRLITRSGEQTIETAVALARSQ